MDTVSIVVKRYLDCGLIPFPLRPGTKLPVKEHYRKDLLPDEIVQIFTNNPEYGVGLYMGYEYSGHWALDFDTPEAYETWKAANIELAAIAPTAKTHKGYHVLFKAPKPPRFAHTTPHSGKGTEVSVISDFWYLAVYPTIHPISKEPYKWLDPLSPWKGFPERTFDQVEKGINCRIRWDVEDYCDQCGEPYCICKDNLFISGAY